MAHSDQIRSRIEQKDVTEEDLDKKKMEKRYHK